VYRIALQPKRLPLSIGHPQRISFAFSRVSRCPCRHRFNGSGRGEP
jgi:hypothetical protein